MTKKRYKHGDCQTRLYNIWKCMRKRCNNPNNPRYKNYGGRGVKVCKEWDDYRIFKIWAIMCGYHDNLTIDRIDNDGDYDSDNCQWMTNSENSKKRWKDATKS